MPEMTPAEALARALEWAHEQLAPDSDGFHSNILTHLRALGFAIVPVDADEAPIERVAEIVCNSQRFGDAEEWFHAH